MKKRWIAAVTLGVFVSSVMIYGRIDLGFDETETVNVQFGEGRARFLNSKDGREYLDKQTDFSIYNDYLDLSLRTGSDRSRVRSSQNLKDLRQLVRAAPENWHDSQIETFQKILSNAKSRLESAGICIWPRDLALIKTDGSVQFGAYYTTGSAIVIPSGQMKFLFVAPRRSALEKTMAHEVWHIVSRQNPELRHRIYSIFGFEPIDELVIPKNVRLKMIANPDVENIGYAVGRQDGGFSRKSIIILQSAYDTYSGAKSPLGFISPLFDYMETRIYDVDPFGSVIGDGELLEQQVDDVIGTISPYRLGPDEIVASAIEALIERSEGEAGYPRTGKNEQLLDQLLAQLKCEE